MATEMQVKPRVVPRPTGYSQPFWTAGKDKKFLVQRDPVSGRHQFYPRPVALWGTRRSPEWVEASGRCTLIALCHTTMPGSGFEAKLPYYLAIALLEEGVRVFAELDAGDRKPSIGDRVEIVWEELSAEQSMFKFRLAD